MTQPTEATVLPTKDEAYARLAKSILRRRAVDQLVTAIKRDMALLPKGHVLAARSEKVLKYMRGYIGAVEQEQQDALANYEGAIVAANTVVEELVKKGKSSLGRVRRNGS
jgi:hypothetical protein